MGHDFVMDERPRGKGRVLGLFALFFIVVVAAVWFFGNPDNEPLLATFKKGPWPVDLSNSLVYSVLSPEKPLSTVESFSLITGQKTLLWENETASDRLIAVSPDHERLLMVTTVDGTEQVIAVNVKNGEKDLLTTLTRSRVTNAIFSSDHTYVLLEEKSTDPRSGSSTISLVEVETGLVHVVAHNAKSPQWSYDQRAIFYHQPEVGGLVDQRLMVRRLRNDEEEISLTDDVIFVDRAAEINIRGKDYFAITGARDSAQVIHMNERGENAVTLANASSIPNVLVSENGEYVVVADSEQSTIYRVVDGKVMWEALGIAPKAVDNDGKKLWSLDELGIMEQTMDGSKIRVPQKNISSWIWVSAL